jgi:hypothetical protein
VAEKFVEFVMRPEGQRLWMLPPGAPGGPRQFALERMAVLPAVYDLPEVKAQGDRTIPFTLPPATFYDAAAENDRLRSELALLREELRIKDARLGRIPARHRPHCPPPERLAILTLRAARGCFAEQTARQFLVRGQGSRPQIHTGSTMRPRPNACHRRSASTTSAAERRMSPTTAHLGQRPSHAPATLALCASRAPHKAPTIAPSGVAYSSPPSAASKKDMGFSPDRK